MVDITNPKMDFSSKPYIMNTTTEINKGKKFPKYQENCCSKVTFLLIALIIISILSIGLNIILLIKINKKQNCGIGYFKPSDDDSNCYKCEIPNCQKCSGSKNNQRCFSCMNNFEEIFGEHNTIINCKEKNPISSIIPETTEPSPTIPVTQSDEEDSTNMPLICENCEICDQIKGKCSKCVDGYYLPEDNESQFNCKKCSIENCKECKGSKSENKCINCKNNFIPVYDENDKNLIISCNSPCEIGGDEKCKTCDETGNKCGSCNTLHVLEKGKCSAEYTIKATYNYQKNNHIKLFETRFVKIKAKMIVNGNITEINLVDNYYSFNEEGENTVYLYLNGGNLNGLFKDCDKLISVYIPSNYFNEIKFTDFYSLFEECISLTSVFISDINSNSLLYLSNMFKGCRSLKSIDLSNVNLRNAKESQSMFSGCTSLISAKLANFEKMENMQSMFSDCISIKSIIFTNFNTTNVKNMAYMFKNCSLLSSLDLSKFILNEINMMHTFENCNSLISLELPTSGMKANPMQYLFYGCYSLKQLDLSHFYTQNAGNFEYLFYNCTSLISLDLASFDTKKVQLMNNMFDNCKSLTSINLSSFITKNIDFMDKMFYNCSSLLSINVSTFDTSTARTFTYLFAGCSSLTSINISNFQIRFYSFNMKYLFANCSNIEYLDISSITSVESNNDLLKFLPKFGTIKYNIKIESFVKKELPYWDYIAVEN